MNKTVLFLINGLGIEHRESCDIYSKEVMPTMDECSITEYFAGIQSPAFDYITGYQIFSTGSTDALAFPFIDKIVDENAWSQNQVHQSLVTSLAQPDSSGIHVFCFIDSNKIAGHLNSFLTSLNVTENTIFVHPILTDQSIEDYKKLMKVLQKINYELLPNTKVGMVFGKNLLFPTEGLLNEFNDVGRMLIRGSGEKWSNIDQKLESLYSFKTEPCNAKAFCVNDQFALKTNDTIIFYGYEDVDCSKFVELITNPPSFFNSEVVPGSLHFYSLFPLKNTPVPNLYPSVVSEFSFSKALKQFGLNGLVLVDQENLNTVNFMINGLSPTGDNVIDYALTDSGILFNEQQLQSVLNNDKYQVIVMNHRIDQYMDATTLKQALTQIDQSLNLVKRLCDGNHTLVVSSLFGMKKTITLDNGKEGIVDFSGRVPVIIIDSRYNKNEYSIIPGNLYTLCSTVIKLAKPDAKVNSMLRKKGFLEKLLSALVKKK